jgi:hypothetical protein
MAKWECGHAPISPCVCNRRGTSFLSMLLEQPIDISVLVNQRIATIFGFGLSSNASCRILVNLAWRAGTQRE